MNNLYHFKDTYLQKNILLQGLAHLKKANCVRIKNNLIIMLILLFTFGCSDNFLDLKQLNQLSNDTFWKSEKDATMGLMGCYDVLQKSWVYSGDHGEASMTVHLDGIAGEAVYRWSWQQYEWFVRNSAAPDTWFFQMTWLTNYMGIARCNGAIANISAMTSDQIKPETANKLVAEAKFVRALLYSNMVSLFHDIPLVTEPQKPTDMPVKADRAAVVAFIQSDLLGCLENLPATRPSSEWGRATKSAAYALLARTNLFNIDNGGTYEKASEYAKNVMNSGGFALFNNYEKLFKTANEINSEIIFPVVFVRGPSDDGSKFVGSWGPTVGNYWLYPLSNLVDDYYCTDGKPIKDPVTGAINPLYNSNNIWSNRDPRLTGTIVGAGALWADNVITAADMSGEPTGLAVRKWREETGTDDRFDSPQDFYVFRYAHILLMRAEALIMSGKFTDPDVKGCINAIRARVNMPSIENAEAAGGQTLNQQDYIQIIRHEWRVETAFEGWSYFNVVRWGQLKKAYDRVNAVDLVRFPGIVRQHIYAPRLEVFPIPTTEMDRNKNLKQNSLWQ